MIDLDPIRAIADRVEIVGDAILIQADCAAVLPLLPKVDAVVTDPPYGIGFAKQPTTGQRKAGMKPRSWDDSTLNEIVESLPKLAPSIIWGGNYYTLPPSRGWLSWHKPDSPPSMADFELAWTSFNMNAAQLSCSIASTNAERVGHPTQKPLRLMRWCFLFLPDHDLILDPFLGSGSTGVAAIQMGRRFIGIERDAGYFEKALKRTHEAMRQSDLFIAPAASAKPVQEAML